MNRYQTTGIINVTGGVLDLNEDQVRRRAHKLKLLENGKYEVMQTVQFKAGETFGYEGELPKSLKVVLLDKPKSKGLKSVK